MMAFFSESVPRDLYERKCKEYDDLLEKYHALRQSGYDPASKIRMIGPKPDSAEQVIRAGEQAFVDPRMRRAVEACLAEGMSEADALREAYRLVNIAKGNATPEAAGNSLPLAKP
jgi:hypothetical protein